MFRALLCGVFVLTVSIDAFGQEATRSRPKRSSISSTPRAAALSVSPTGDNVLMIQTARYPSIEEVAAPMLRLAGVRLNPKTNGPTRPPASPGCRLCPLPGANEAARAARQGANRVPVLGARRQTLRGAQHHRCWHRVVGLWESELEKDEGR